MKATKEQLDEYTKAYSQGKPIISDEVYDQLLEEYLEGHGGEGSRPFLRQKQSDSVSSILGTLPKVYGVTQPMRDGQKTYKQWLKTKGINPNSKIIIQPKFDGCSLAMDSQQQFFTRGDYDNGESVDVTDLFAPYYKYCFHEYVEGVKFEGIISKETFYEYHLDKTYKTPRDAVAGIISSRNVELSELITLIPLRESVNTRELVCGELQDISINDATADDFDCIQQFIVNILNNGASTVYNDGNHYVVDGVVISVLNEDGSTVEEIAIKILNDINETKLIKVDFQFGKTGRITPVAVVEPVSFCDGKRTIDHITLSTLERIVNMDLRYGDTVRVMYNIVPYFLESYHNGSIPIQIPTKCPICGDPLDMKTLKQVRCKNPNCPGLISGLITRYCVHMKMFGISEATVNRLYDEGLISSISDLYKLKVSDIMNLEGFGETSGRNIVNSINKASTDIPVSRWLGALPFKDVNSKTWDIVLNSIFGRDEMKKSNGMVSYILQSEQPSDFLNQFLVQYIPGVGVATKRAIHEGWLRNFNEMKEIIKNISFKITTDVNSNNSKGVVTFTGIRDSELTDRLIKAGYNIRDFSSKTNILIVPDKDYVSNKVVKANNMGISIYTIKEVNETLI